MCLTDEPLSHVLRRKFQAAFPLCLSPIHSMSPTNSSPAVPLISQPPILSPLPRYRPTLLPSLHVPVESRLVCMLEERGGGGAEYSVLELTNRDWVRLD